MPTSFSQLLSKLLDNVNLGQILVDGGPGVLLTLAILLFASQRVQIDKAAVPSDTLSQAGQLEIAACIPTENGDLTARLPFVKLILRGDINRLKTQIGACEKQYAALAGRSANEDQQLQNLAKGISAAEQGRVNIGTGPSTCTTGSLCSLYDRLATLRKNKATDDKELEFAAKHLDDLRSTLEKKRQEYTRDGRSLLSELINLFLGLSIFGYILGTLFSGVNHTVWLLTVQRWILLTVGRAWDSLWLHLASSPEEEAKIVLRSHMRLVELRMGTAVVLAPQSREHAVTRLKQKIGEADGGRKWALNKRENEAIQKVRADLEGPQSLQKYPVSYYLGRGIISQQDYDEFVKRYYRWAEAAANLIIPVLALGYALQCYGGVSVSCPSTSGVDCFGFIQRSFAWLENHPFCAALLLAMVLYIAAQFLYGDYKQRLRSFIDGKLDTEKQKKEEAKNQAPPQGGLVKPPRQRLEIIADGEQAAEILKLIEQALQGRKS